MPVSICCTDLSALQVAPPVSSCLFVSNCLFTCQTDFPFQSPYNIFKNIPSEQSAFQLAVSYRHMAMIVRIICTQSAKLHADFKFSNSVTWGCSLCGLSYIPTNKHMNKNMGKLKGNKLFWQNCMNKKNLMQNMKYKSKCVNCI